MEILKNELDHQTDSNESPERREILMIIKQMIAKTSVERPNINQIILKYQKLIDDSTLRLILQYHS